MIKIRFLLVQNGGEESCKLHKFFCQSSLYIVVIIRQNFRCCLSQGFGFISSRKIIVGVICLILMSLMPIEETVETRVRTDCLNFDSSQCIQIEKQLSITGRTYWDYTFMGDFRSHCSSRLHKISYFNLITNVLLHFVRDITYGVCWQRYEKRLEQKNGRRNVNVGVRLWSMWPSEWLVIACDMHPAEFFIPFHVSCCCCKVLCVFRKFSAC